MRILLVNGRAYPHLGGAENSLRYIGSELLGMGHDVKVFCFQQDPSESLRDKFEGVEIIRCRYEISRWPHIRVKRQVEAVSKYIGPILQEFKPDSIWSRSATIGLGTVFGGYAGKVFHIFPTTAYMDSRGLYLNTVGLPVFKRLKGLGLWPFAYVSARRIERELMARCHPISFSENMRRQLIKTYGKLAEKVRVIRPGVDMERFSPGNGKRCETEIGRRYGLSPDEPLIVYVGRLSVAKNIPFLIDSLNHMLQSARLVIVGGGHEEEHLRSYVGSHNLCEKVFFVGQQDELLPGFYTMAKVCVLPSLIESFGQSCIESMACGTPVVALASDGRKVLTATEEIVKNGRSGRIVREISVKAMAEALDEILALPASEYEAMSGFAIDDVRRRFSWSDFVRQMLLLVEKQQ